MIDKAKAVAAIAKMVQEGRASQEDAQKYQKTVDLGLSYADLILSELGKEMGTRYLQEEFVQGLELEKKRLPFDTLSVPEVLLLENKEPWHRASYSALPGAKKFSQEAAEPWHPSLRSRFSPDPEVSAWFNSHPQYFEMGVRILATVYRDTAPSEEDLAKLARGG